MGASIQINGITHRFSGKGPNVLENLVFDMAAGRSTALIGESGCGKSTLLHMLAGLMLPTEGCVRINGQQVTKPHPEWNMMFQRPGLYPWLNVRQNVALGLQFTGKTEALAQRVDEMLALVGLSDKGAARPQDLSGGQQQRVALARSLAVEPDVILLDEPFSALDAFTRRNLQLEVRHIAREKNITLVLVTHDIDEALTMGDSVVVMGRNPGTFQSVMNIDLAYPRNPIDPKFAKLREDLMARFKHSVEGQPQARQTSFDAIANNTNKIKTPAHERPLDQNNGRSSSLPLNR
ncbi:ABC transporter ATP-binding protein [Vreelandella neptunia]|uniref:ABC transporter ATP-binding protein n=1 Tax=Vreelandella neptunia TaxID=115551 RepID=A0ABS9S4Y2_9GAMM|nr:ABC transporter ATP-binding protein [Halomonas neptunia]MCH4811149.1 ABC transporter ATP-binding protein [Halomonas neptunia]